MYFPNWPILVLPMRQLQESTPDTYRTVIRDALNITVVWDGGIMLKWFYDRDYRIFVFGYFCGLSCLLLLNKVGMLSLEFFERVAGWIR